MKRWTDVGGGLQALHDSEGANAKVFSKDRKEAVKECCRPTYTRRSKPPTSSFNIEVAHTNFRQDKYDGLEYDEDPVQDRPEGSARLVRNGTVSR